MPQASAVSIVTEPAPPFIRYIKLGPGNRWAAQAFARGELPLGHKEMPHELALAGDAEAIVAHLVAQGRSVPKARDFAREILDFYRLGPETIWITFVDGRLWWAKAAQEVVWLGQEETGEEESHGARMRRTLAPWSDRDANGRVLLASQLSTRLTKVGSYRQTLCAVEAQDYLLQKLAGEEDPLVGRARALREEAVGVAGQLIGRLHWADFETLVDLLLARGGWHRMSALGGTQKDADLLAEQAVTGETAFVQVKSAASQAVLDDYIERFDANPAWSRLIFACHRQQGDLTAHERSDVTLWTRDGLAEAAIRNGLLDWLIQRAG